MPQDAPKATLPFPRGTTLVVLVVISLMLHVGASRASTPTPVTDRPNIVVILLDDLDWAVFDAAIGNLPAVQNLQARGTTFDQYYVTTPLCCPSRSSLLRGQYAHNHGVLWNRGEPGGNGGFEAFHRLGRETDTVATALHDAGYRTGLFGKYLNGYPMSMPETYEPPGWDDWAVHTASERDAFYIDYDLNVNGTIVSYGSAPEDYSTDVLRDFGAAFIRSTPVEQPLFLVLAPYAPHAPSMPAVRHVDVAANAEFRRAPSFNESDVSDKPEWVRKLPPIDAAITAEIDADVANRVASLMAIDDMVAEVSAALEESGRGESTYIVFLSDNGFHFGEHRVPFGKVTPYGESTRVPMIVVGPGVPAGSHNSAIVANIDLFPTFLGWAGVTSLPEFVDGRDVAGVINLTEDPTRQRILLEQFEDVANRAPRAVKPPKPGKKLKDRTPTPTTTTSLSQAILPPFRAVRDATSLFVVYETGELEYYDLVSDPYAMNNLATQLDPVFITAQLALVDSLATCAGASCRELEDGENASPQVGQ